MADIYDTFSKKLTTIIVTVDENISKEKHLPCFTIGPKNVHKKLDFITNSKTFRKTLRMEMHLVVNFSDSQKEYFIGEFLKSFLFRSMFHVLSYKTKSEIWHVLCGISELC
jgi:hypothetical protein